jgi:CO/xanthine dehydrogenase Mo-binding subunit
MILALPGDRPEILARLEARVRYLGDTPMPGALVGRVLRSPHAHARIARIDTAAARALPGVRAVVGAADAPAGFLHGIRRKDQPIFATDRVRYIGEPVAAVAADSAEAAEAALRAIRVDYEPLPLVTDPEAALSARSFPIHEGGNLCHSARFARGDTTAAFARAAHVVEHTLLTPRQMHAALELEGGVAAVEGDRLTVWSPSQHPHGARAVIAGTLGWAEDRITVIGSPIGGSYGGKEDVHVQPILALLAVRAGAPVRMVLTREENVAAGVKRHVFRIRMRSACDAEGRLLALEMDALADTGGYASHGPEVLDTAHECAQGPYAIPNVLLVSRLAYTNTGNAGAFRGFGASQTQAAIEIQMDLLARATGLPPAEIRRRNLPGPDAPGPLGQPVLPRPETRATAEALARAAAAPRPASAGRWIRGRGVALVQKGEGFAAGGPNGAAARLSFEGGRFLFHCGVTEMGQGAESAARAALARTLGIAGEDVAVALGATAATPDAGPTSASRGTQVLLRLARAGAPPLRERVLAEAALRLARPASELALGPGGVYRVGAGANRPLMPFAEIGAVAPVEAEIAPLGGPGLPGIEAHALLTTCAALAEVAVDRLTGRVRAERIAVLPACGSPLVPDAFRAQVEGGAAMALGFALLEDLPASEGRYLHRNLDGYLVPTIADMPPIEVEPIDALDPDDPVGLRGIGEIGMNAVGPALVAAVHDALGHPPARLPVDPEWVLRVLTETGA